MIDAYEIGIQLALQDGVSAGLEVISRELAEVDRAVAATSAGLLNLTHAAEATVRAITAAAGARAPVMPNPSVEPTSGVTESVTPTSTPPQRPLVTSSEPPQVAASVVAQAPTAPTIDRSAGRASEVAEAGRSAATAAEAQPALPVPTMDAVAPVVVPQAATAAAPLQLGPAAPITSTTPATTSELRLRNSAPIRGAATSQTPRIERVAPSAPARSSAPMTASVARAVAPRAIQVGVQPATTRPASDPLVSGGGGTGAGPSRRSRVLSSRRRRQERPGSWRGRRRRSRSSARPARAVAEQ